MEDKIIKKSKSIAVLAFAVSAACVLLYFLLFRSETVFSWLSSLFNVLSPIIFGFVIAYILNPGMCLIENQCLKIYAKRKKTPSKRAMDFIRFGSALSMLFMLLLLCYALFALVIPELVSSIRNIIGDVPRYSANLQNWYNELVEKYAIDESSKGFMREMLASVQTWIAEQFSPQFNSVLARITSSVLGGLIVFKNVILGLFVSIYVLVSKDSILARAKRILYAFFNAATANRVLKNIHFVDEKFGGFLIGKLIDSAIIGVITYIVLSIMSMPYTLLVSVVIGITNIIPFFGPFIGAIPSAILIACVSPMQALYFLIFIFILQQFDGNLLGPKILGNSVGISSFMVLVAILLGGGLFGFVGMIIGVPLCAIIISVVQSAILQRLARKNMPGDIEAYNHIDHFDPISRTIVKEPTTAASTSFYRYIQERSESTKNFYTPLEENAWDRKLEEVEQDRLSFKKSWEADKKYTDAVAALHDGLVHAEISVPQAATVQTDAATAPKSVVIAKDPVSDKPDELACHDQSSMPAQPTQTTPEAKS